MGYIDLTQLETLAQPLKKNDYGQYLLRLVSEEQAHFHKRDNMI